MYWTNIYILGVAAGYITLVSAQESYFWLSGIKANITSGYDVDTAPDSTTTISIQLGLISLLSLDTRAEKLTVSGFFLMRWTDGRLVWNASDFNGYDQIKIKMARIWTPPITIANAGNGIKLINDDDGLASLYINVFNDGTVVWLSPANIDAQCSMNIKYYPFDKQECTIIISSWLFTADEIRFTPHPTVGINVDLYEINGEWGLISKNVQSKERELLGHTMATVRFTIGFERKYSYYLLNMMLPVVLLTAISPLVFALPVESGEMNGFVLTILLSLSVLITVVSDNIPPSSTTVSILSVYLLVTFILATVETYFVVLVCKLYNKTSQGKKPGPKLQTACRFLETITCMHSCKHKDDDDKPKRNIVTPLHGKQPTVTDDDNDDMKEYSYEDFANLINRFCLFAFFILTALLTLIFMVILTVGRF